MRYIVEACFFICNLAFRVLMYYLLFELEVIATKSVYLQFNTVQ